jgi:hypothetical protein
MTARRTAIATGSPAIPFSSLGKTGHFDDSLAFAKLLGAVLTECGLAYSAHHAEPIRGEGPAAHR